MYRNLGSQGHPEQAESSHKDAVISSLKKELFELKDLEHDFIRLNDEVANIESKYALLLDEKERTENEHKYKYFLFLESRWKSTRRISLTSGMKSTI